MTEIEDEMAAALISAGFATAAGTDLFAYAIQSSPVAQIMVRPTGGETPILSIDSSTPRPGVQVYVVDSDLKAARDKASEIREYFALGKGTIRQAITAARSTVIYLGQLDDGRHKFVVEFKIFG
jgi:hypothetical protein